MIYKSILHKFIMYVIDPVLQSTSVFQHPALTDSFFLTGQYLSTQLICIISSYLPCY